MIYNSVSIISITHVTFTQKTKVGTYIHTYIRTECILSPINTQEMNGMDFCRRLLLRVLSIPIDDLARTSITVILSQQIPCPNNLIPNTFMLISYITISKNNNNYHCIILQCCSPCYHDRNSVRGISGW